MIGTSKSNIYQTKYLYNLSPESCESRLERNSKKSIKDLPVSGFRFLFITWQNENQRYVADVVAS